MFAPQDKISPILYSQMQADSEMQTSEQTVTDRQADTDRHGCRYNTEVQNKYTSISLI